MAETEIIDLINQYGLVVVISGLLASILCSIVKTPIVHHIQSLGLSEKDQSTRIRTVCLLIVSILSIIFVVTYHCIVAKSLAPFKDIDMYHDIMGSITFSQISYAMYQGIGKVSIKKWLHDLYNTIKNNKESLSEENQEAFDEVTDLITRTRDILKNQLHLPLTDNQAEALEKSLRGITDEEEDNNESTNSES